MILMVFDDSGATFPPKMIHDGPVGRDLRIPHLQPGRCVFSFLIRKKVEPGRAGQLINDRIRSVFPYYGAFFPF